jgi:hypothetical protein
MSFQDAYNVPIAIRRWWIKRINKAIEDQNKAQEEASKGKR